MGRTPVRKATASVPPLAALAIVFATAATVQAESDSPARHVETWRSGRASAPQRGRLVVAVSGLQPQVGRLLVALYDKTTPFLSFEYQLDRQRVGVSGRTTQAVFENVPYGNYAVAVVYDRNNNNKLDLRLGVFPTEPLGFSSGATVGTFGPPRYRAAAFDLAAPELTIPVAVK